MRHTIVVGAGIFGVTASIELAARGDRVTLIEPGPVPHRLAESTDISKVIRADYGSDALYTELMERALEGWRDWNATLAKGLFHECGVLFVTRRPMTPGAFEHDSFAMLTGRGHPLERIGGAELTRRFAPWNGDAYVDGYFNPLGGYAESGAVVAALAKLARDRGVDVREGVRIVSEHRLGDRVSHLRTDAGDELRADCFVYAVGSWSGGLLADLAPSFRATGHPVLHFSPPALDRFAAARFPVFGADISRTGVYGFPAIAGVVKVASHGPGRVVDPSSDAERTVNAGEEAEIRDVLRSALRELGDAPLAATRICVYGDTRDGDLWIAPDPRVPNRIVAAGGSGHAFKFAPLLGKMIADACDGTVIERFRWRPEIASAKPSDAARQV